jgi:hypothetical protein
MKCSSSSSCCCGGGDGGGTNSGGGGGGGGGSGGGELSTCGGSVENLKELYPQIWKYYWLLKISVTWVVLLFRDLNGIELVADMGLFDILL